MSASRRFRLEFNARRKQQCLAAIARHGRLGDGADAVGISRRTLGRHIKDDPEFAKQVEEAQDVFRDCLVKEAYRRAVEGTDKPIVYHGEVTGHMKQYSDVLLLALLKANLREFQDRQTVVHEGKNEVTVKFEEALRRMPKEARDQFRRTLQEIEAADETPVEPSDDG